MYLCMCARARARVCVCIAGRGLGCGPVSVCLFGGVGGGKAKSCYLLPAGLTRAQPEAKNPDTIPLSHLIP
jgi:hypothetical protein